MSRVFSACANTPIKRNAFFLNTLIYAYRVLKRNLKVFYRLYKTNLIINFIEPSIYLFAFGLGLGGFVSGMNGMSYIEYIAPGMVAYSGLFAASFESLYGTYTRMVHQKTFDAILATPVTPEGLILGEIFYSAFKAILFSLIIMLVVYAAGLIPSPLFVLSLPFIIIGGITFSSLSMIVTALVKGIDSLNYYITLVLTPLYLLSGIFFPLEGALKKIGALSPFYHTAAICQTLAAGSFKGILLNGLILTFMMCLYSLQCLP
jgi:lipooligosaccharide transport system permease protein